jgi:hypothetical protein
VRRRWTPLRTTPRRPGARSGDFLGHDVMGVTGAAVGVDDAISQFSVGAPAVGVNGAAFAVHRGYVDSVEPGALDRQGSRLIPFDTYNLFYRDDLERTRLAPLRRLQQEVIPLAPP